jgi:hypothetical protein
MVSNALERIRKAARRTGAGVAVVSIPEGFFVNREAYANLQRIGFQTTPEMLQSNAADDAVGEACKRRGIPFHAVSDQFREHIDEKGLYFELDRHFTAKGNLLYGDLVTPFVAEELRRSREAGR